MLGLVIAAAICVFVFTTAWAPGGFFILTWAGCAFWLSYDKAPWHQTRAAFALLVGWLADVILYRVALTWLPGSFRHFVPAIIVVSAYLAYLVWDMTRSNVDRAAEKPEPGLWNPIAGRTAFVLAIFLLVYVEGPLLHHFFPHYWSRVFESWRHLPNDDNGYDYY